MSYPLLEWLRAIWRAWQALGRLIGDFVARLVRTILYFTIFVPFALGVRLLADPLDIRAHKKLSWWHTRTTQTRTMQDALRQG